MRVRVDGDVQLGRLVRRSLAAAYVALVFFDGERLGANRHSAVAVSWLLKRAHFS
jgi:hypothetical protein